MDLYCYINRYYVQIDVYTSNDMLSLMFKSPFGTLLLTLYGPMILVDSAIWLTYPPLTDE